MTFHAATWVTILVIFISQEHTVTGTSPVYSSSYVYGTFTNRETGSSEKLCINYQQWKTVRMPDQGFKFPLKFWTGSEDTSLCPSSPSSPIDGAIVPVDYRQAMHKSCNEPSYARYSRIQDGRIQGEKAAASLFVVEKGRTVEIYTPTFRDYLFADFMDINLGNETLPTFYIYESLLKSTIATLGGNPNDIDLTIVRSPDFLLDYGVVAIWLLAMICIVIGGYWSGEVRYALHLEEKKRDRRRRKRRERKAKKMAALAAQVAEEQRRNGGHADVHDVGLEEINSSAPVVHKSKKRKASLEPSTSPMTMCSMFIFIVMIVSVLLLAYYFRAYFIWVFIVLFVIGSATALFECMAAVYGACSSKMGCGQCRVGPSLGSAYKSLTGNDIFPSHATFHTRPKAAHVVMTIVALSTSVTWCIFRNRYGFVLQDLLSTCFCINVIKSVRVPNLKYLAILLSCLLIYDLFMVFVTPFITTDGCSIMVKVATGGGCTVDPNAMPIAPIEQMNRVETIPVLFQVPRFGDSMVPCYDMDIELNYKPMILGMGDVILPGLLVGFCFGIDRVWNIGSHVYSVTVTAAYAVGLIITFIALFTMDTAQPALIYLVPASLIPVVLVTLLRGQFVDLWTGEQEKDRRLRLEKQTGISETDAENGGQREVEANEVQEVDDEHVEGGDGEDSEGSSDDEENPTSAPTYGALREGGR